MTNYSSATTLKGLARLLDIKVEDFSCFTLDQISQWKISPKLQTLVANHLPAQGIVAVNLIV